MEQTRYPSSRVKHFQSALSVFSRALARKQPEQHLDLLPGNGAALAFAGVDGVRTQR
jgi:hypothetical protein